jgi:hypothetical protein
MVPDEAMNIERFSADGFRPSDMLALTPLVSEHNAPACGNDGIAYPFFVFGDDEDEDDDDIDEEDNFDDMEDDFDDDFDDEDFDDDDAGYEDDDDDYDYEEDVDYDDFDE